MDEKERNGTMAEEKILIVEDEAIVAMEIEGRLTKLGYGIAGSVSTGEAAIAAAQKTMPALVLMDIMLAGEIDGVHASAEIRRRFNIPVVFLTAYADEKTLKRAKLTEPFGYLMKPFEEIELRTTIEVALYKHAMGKKLQESELLFRTLFERAGDAIYIIETEGGQSGRIKDANKAAARMHGYTVEELRGMKIWSLNASDTGDEAAELISRILKGEWVKKEVEHRRKDGSVFPVEISAGLLELGSRTYILAFDRDISERKRAEEALAKKEQSLAKAQQIAHVGNWDWNIVANELWWSDEIYRIFGVQPREFEATYDAFLRYVHPEDRAMVEGAVQQALAGTAPYSIDHRIIRPDGSERVVHEEAELVRNEAGAAVLMSGTVQDISERKRAEELLQQGNDTQTVINELLSYSLLDSDLFSVLQRAIDLILSVTWISFESRGCIFLAEGGGKELVLAVQRNMHEHTLKSCARLAAGKCLCGRAALTKELVFAARIDERHDLLQDRNDQHGHYCVPILHGDILLGVVNIYLQDGHARSAKEEKFLVAVANALAGIIRRRKAEDEREQLHQELQATYRKVVRSQKEWQVTFDSITDLVSIHDERHMIVKANKAFADHFKLGLKEIVNRKCYDLFHHTDAPILNCPHSRSLALNQPMTEEVRDPKTERVLQVSTFPYVFPDSEERGTVHIARDITSEREKEMRLIMSERLASLGQMASGIAHEINNPLAAIAGCSEGLLNRVRQDRFDPEFFANYLTIINEEIARCKGITTSMLSIVRQTSYVQKTVDVHEVLDKTLEIIGFQGRLRTVDVIKEYHEALPFIHGSEGELKQVFLAIITNALDALDGKGVLTIGTDAAQDAVLIRISDTGPGIPPEHLQKLFQPFFTTKLDKGGTGLGLSIARKIVDAHNGRIEVSTELSRGTTFTITLPMPSGDEVPQT